MGNKNIEKALSFLIEEYKCNFKYENDHGDHYFYENNDFKVVVYEWCQFDELKISIIYNYQYYKIDPAIEKPKEYYKIMGNNRLRRFFHDEKALWNLIARIIKEKIDAIKKNNSV